MLNVPYEVKFFIAAESADAHCQMNNIALGNQFYLDWMDETLG
jgi:hypothetical protein